ncbi:MAG: hypothetical protein M0Q46_06675, partial [Endomicrobiales bacterium]|nr:hypothetical protein [Endomicrobiales bacterium]
MLNEKNTKNLRQEFKDSLSTWHEAINPAQLHYADVIKKSWKNTTYVVRNLPFAPEKLVVCPPHSILNMAPNQQHRTDYASGVFEGLSAEPQLDAAGKIKDISVVLLMPRMQRLMRSMR